MGTSKSYEAPTTPQWKKAKTAITHTAQIPDLQPAHVRIMLATYIAANGGASGMATGKGAIGSNKSAQRVARNLGSFAARSNAVGFAPALAEAGLANAKTRSSSEVTAFLVNHLSGNESTIDDADARAALSRLLRELAQDEEDEQRDEVLAAALSEQRFPSTLNQFYALYLFEQFCRVAYDRLVEKIGAERADAFLADIRRFIDAKVREEGQTRDLSTIDWSSAEGKEVADQLFESVLDIYGGEVEE